MKKEELKEKNTYIIKKKWGGCMKIRIEEVTKETYFINNSDSGASYRESKGDFHNDSVVIEDMGLSILADDGFRLIKIV